MVGDDMDKYKPGYLGKVLPENKSDIADFMHNKYDGFSKVYDACKSESDKISDIKPAKTDSDDNKTYAVKVSVTDQSALENIKNNNNDTSVKIDGDVISADCK
jgi:uncharacterized protein (DUF4415 family)